MAEPLQTAASAAGIAEVTAVAEPDAVTPAQAAPGRAPGVASAARQRLARLIRRPGLLLSWLVLVTVVLAAVAPRLFTSVNPIEGVDTEVLKPPSAAHIFGTDELGRDLYSRVVYGTSNSLESVVLAVFIGLVVGTILGLTSGFIGGKLDAVAMRVIDVMLSVPSLLVALAIIAAYGVGIVHIAIAVGVGSIASFARISRSEVFRIKAAPFVEAATFSGRRRLGILLTHVAPNVMPQVFVLATLEVGIAILNVAALSFLGFGAPPPQPEWGSLIADGRNYMVLSWWMVTLPGIVLAVTVLSVNRIARSFDTRRVGVL